MAQIVVVFIAELASTWVLDFGPIPRSYPATLLEPECFNRGLPLYPRMQGYETYLNFWIPEPGYVDLFGIAGITMNFCYTLCFPHCHIALTVVRLANPT